MLFSHFMLLLLLLLLGSVSWGGLSQNLFSSVATVVDKYFMYGGYISIILDFFFFFLIFFCVVIVVHRYFMVMLSFHWLALFSKAEEKNLDGLFYIVIVILMILLLWLINNCDYYLKIQCWLWVLFVLAKMQVNLRNVYLFFLLVSEVMMEGRATKEEKLLFYNQRRLKEGKMLESAKEMPKPCY